MKQPTIKLEFSEVLPKICKIGLFDDFSASKSEDIEMFRALYEKFFSETYEKGDLIIREGDVGKELYILIKGSVQIFRTTQFGDEIAIADLDSSSDVYFGESALIDDDERSATVRAAGKCEVLVLKGNDFVEFCQKYPLLGFSVYRKITKRMQQTIKRANKDVATLYAALFREIEGTN